MIIQKKDLPLHSKVAKTSIARGKTCMQLAFNSLALSLHSKEKTVARVAKLVDAPDLGSGVLRRVGSSPITRTIEK